MIDPRDFELEMIVLEMLLDFGLVCENMVRQFPSWRLVGPKTPEPACRYLANSFDKTNYSGNGIPSLYRGFTVSDS